jgi:predicted nucleic acid-binding protein
MVYVDTSVIVKLYIREDYSQEASNWVTGINQAIPMTLFTHWSSPMP